MVAENILFTDSQEFTDDVFRLYEVDPDLNFVCDNSPVGEGIVSVHLADPHLVYLSSQTRSGRGLYVKVAFVEGEGFVRTFARSDAPGRADSQQYQKTWAATRGGTPSAVESGIGYADVLPLLTEASPGYARSPERTHVDEQDGPYIHLLYFVLYLIRLLAEDETETFPAVFGMVDKVLCDGDARARDLIMAGFIESLTNGNHYRDVPVSPSDFLGWYGSLAREHEYVQEMAAREHDG
jgi:hypothetical protein